MPNGVFECGTPKCHESIAISGLNDIQLQVLRRWAKTCPRCNQRTKWQEKQTLLKTETTKLIGGSKNAVSNTTVPKSQSQKRRAARHDGQH